MGIHDLLTLLKKHLGLEKPKHHLSRLSGQRVAVDFSNVMFGALFSPENKKDIAIAFTAIPRVDLGPLISKYFDKFSAFFRHHNVEPLLVFDGARNPLKAETNAERMKPSDEGLSELLEYIKSTAAFDESELTKLAKKCVYVREDVMLASVEWAIKNKVAYLCAPIEADWMLAYLEWCNIVQGVLSKDSDMLLYGVKNLIIEPNYSVLEPGANRKANDHKEYFNCTILTNDDFENFFKTKISNSMTKLDITACCIMLGCDYLGRPFGFGFDYLAKKFKEHWFTAPEGKSLLQHREQILSNIESDCKWVLTERKRKQAIVAYKSGFKKAFMQFVEPAVFTLEGGDGSWTSAELFQCIASGSDGLQVVLGGFVRDEMKVALDSFLNFGDVQLYNPRTALMGDCDDLTFFKLKVWPRNGRKLSDFRIPLPTAGADNISYPHGAVLDFTQWPPERQFETVLLTWIQHRGFQTRANLKHADLVRMVNYVSRHTVQFPIVQQDSSVGGGKYIAMEQLTVTTSLLWHCVGADVLQYIRGNIPAIDELFLSRQFGTRCGVRNRAILWTLGGHCDVETLSFATCKLRGTTDAVIIRMKCTPSQSSGAYDTYLIFDLETKTFCPAPVSRCTCKAGNFFCAHMLACLLVISIIQKHLDISMEQLVKVMPEPVRCIQALPIPFQYVYGIYLTEEEGNVEGDEEEGKEGNSTSQVVRAEGVLSRLRNSAPGRKLSAEGEDGDGELEDIFHASDGEEDGGDDDLNDAVSEGDENEKENGSKGIARDIIGEVQGYVAERIRVLETLADPVADTARVVSKQEIDHFTAKMLKERGPNSTTAAKLEQLQQHQRYHVCVKNGLLPHSVMSFYCENTEEWRLQLIKALEDGDAFYLDAHDPQFATRLMKIPVGWVILADRGFAFDSLKYPNFNVQITPHFIGRRDRFTQEEIESDVVKCKLRYVSETFFSRITAESSLADVIAYQYFDLLQHIVDWAHGAANLNAPFYNPDTYKGV